MSSKWLVRLGGILLLCLAVSATASAQYGGGGSGGSGGSGSGGSGATSSGYGSGNGKAIGIGVGAAAGAAVGIALYVHHRHAKAKEAGQQSQLVGCTRSEINGISLKNENDEQTYMIISSDRLQTGQRVELTGVVSDQGSGTRVFRVRGPIKSDGTCNTTDAALASTPTARAK